MPKKNDSGPRFFIANSLLNAKIRREITREEVLVTVIYHSHIQAHECIYYDIKKE